MQKISVFWRYFISYLLVLFIPFTIVVQLYGMRQNELIRENTYNYYKNMLISALNDTESVFAEVRDVKYSVEHSLWLRNLCISNLVDGSPSASAAADAMRSLSFLHAQSRTISAVSVALFDSDTIYSSSGPYNRNSGFGPSFFSSGADGSARLYHDESDSPSNSRLVFSSQITNTYDTFYSNYPKGELNVTLRCKPLLDALSQLLDEGVVFTLSCDAEPKFSLSAGAFPEGYSGEYETLELPSDTISSIHYTLRIPSTIYFTDLNSQQEISLTATAAVGLLALILCSVFSYMNFLPIRRLRAKLSDGVPSHGDELAHISRGIETIREKYRSAEQQLTDSRPSVIRSLFFTLLFDEYDSNLPREFEKQQLVLNLPLFCAIAARIESPDGALSFSLVRQTCLYYLRRGNLRGYLYELSSGKFCILVNYREPVEFDSFLSSFVEDCSALNAVGGTIQFGVGLPTDDLSGFSQSFSEADHALEAGSLSHLEVRRYSGFSSGKYNYSPTDELSLQNSIKKGDASLAQRIIDQVVSRNLDSGAFHSSFIRCLPYQLLSTLLRTAAQMDLPPEQYLDAEYLVRCGSLSSAVEYLKKAAKKMADTAQPESGERPFEDELISFVKAHLCEGSLSLQMVAGHFEVSMSYISQIFKRKYGVSYSEYVNRERIARVCELHRKSGEPVTKLAASVGYDSISTFRRNFIKYTGSTPGSFSE